MPDENYSLNILRLLPESRLAVDMFRRSLELSGGGILILRGPSGRRDTTEAVFCTDRFTDFRKLL